MPYFISLVVICRLVEDFTNVGGIINQAHMRIIIPLSMPVIAVIILYTAVERWNG